VKIAIKKQKHTEERFIKMKNRYPKKFVGLHSHGTFSIGDAIGMPQDHIDFAIENGMDALALTDHGNMNGFTHQYLHYKKLAKKGVNFKTLPGVEAYFIDSLSDWNKLYIENRENKQLKKLAAKGDTEAIEALELQAKFAENPFLISDNSKKMEEDMVGGTVVEDEDASKRNKFKDPLKQRNHLVLLPKNLEGLEALFQMVSRSYIDGFYRFPRMDFDMLKKYANGNIIATSACVAGKPGRLIFDRQTEPDWDTWAPNMDNFEEIQGDLKEMVDKFKWALGEENYYLELQFNKLLPQHLVNQHLIECSKRTKTPLVVTTDAHYSRPEHWRQREIYKMMAWSSKGMDMDKETLPKAIDELKCELYPKNAEQVWEAYKSTTKDKGWDFYDDDVVCDAIERTYDIAHDQIDKIEPDTKVKLPSISYLVDKPNIKKIEEKFGKDVDEETSAFQELKRQAISGMKYRGLLKSQEHIDRLKEELKVVKHLKFSKYFLTYSKIMEDVSSQMLCGLARGSAAGSLLSYVLNITQLDPIKYGLLFARFLTRFKKGYPDIDCLRSGTLVKKANGKYAKIESLLPGDFILDHAGTSREVLACNTRAKNINDVLIDLYFYTGTCYGSITATSKHRLVNSVGEFVYVGDISVGDIMHSLVENKVQVIGKEYNNSDIDLVDITVEGSSTFQFVPYNCAEFETNEGNFLVSTYNYSIDADLFEAEFRKEYYGNDTKRNCGIIRL